MSDIKIFVSHRIDLNSEIIQNPLYIPVRCGAVFDGKNPRGLQGDDIGDNISQKRMTFCEFTVQYWAWKNVQADYYGLCHYRRYLSFAQKRYPVNEHHMIRLHALLPQDKYRYGLMDAKRMEQLISQYDIVTSEPAPVCKIPTPEGTKETVREMWDAHDGVFFEKKSIDLMFDLIDELAPEYSQSARAYFAGGYHRGYNCYVMRKELFDRLCRFQFPILFELERRLDMTGYSPGMKRTPGYIGEMLYGIFLYHEITRAHLNVKELQLLFIDNVDCPATLAAWIWRYIRHGSERLLRLLVDPIFPLGTARRENLKRLLRSGTPEEPLIAKKNENRER